MGGPLEPRFREGASSCSRQAVQRATCYCSTFRVNGEVGVSHEEKHLSFSTSVIVLSPHLNSTFRLGLTKLRAAGDIPWALIFAQVETDVMIGLRCKLFNFVTRCFDLLIHLLDCSAIGVLTRFMETYGEGENKRVTTGVDWR